MRAPRQALVDHEREFRVDELFFSTTNPKGIIEVGNDVFTRVAGYDEAELLGAPHNLVRHPDMPRAAFRLVWDRLRADRPVGALVKNLAKDGSYYWVLAMMAPIETGYISIRSKPCSALLPVVEEIYRAMVDAERRADEAGLGQAATMDAGEEVLTAALARHGFSDYDDFASRALLPQEMAARRAKLAALDAGRAMRVVGGRADPFVDALHGALDGVHAARATFRATTGRMDRVLAHHATTVESSRQLTHATEVIGLMATNVSLCAVRLRRAGRGVGVIATYLGEGAHRLGDLVAAMARRLHDASAHLGRVVVELGWAELEYEMVDRALAELDRARAGGGPTDLLRRRVLSLRRLCASITGTRTRIAAALGPFQRAMSGLSGQVDAARDLVMSLEAAHIRGRVETAQIPSARDATVILDELRRELGEARARFEGLQDALLGLAGVGAVAEAAEAAVAELAIDLPLRIEGLERAAGLVVPAALAVAR